MGAGAISGEQPSSDNSNQSNHHSYPPSTAVCQTPPAMSCEDCSIRFSLLKRKKLCSDCGRYFCSACSRKVVGGLKIRAIRRCSKCQIILAGDFTKQDLMPLRVKDLRFFLVNKNINIRTCTEKGHLVDLIFLNFANSTHQALQQEHEHYVGMLAARMREDINEEQRQRAERQQREANADPGERTNDHEPSDSDDDLDLNVEPEATSSRDQEETSSESPQANETEEERVERLRQRQEQEMQETLNRLQEELRQNENDHDDRPANVRAKLTDISALEDIEKLSVKQLKEILATNFVDYKGCCEKYELAERVQRLWQEHQNDVKRGEDIKASQDEKVEAEDSADGELCKICMDAPIECVLLECGHMVACTKCGRRLAECPICRQNVVRAVRIFRA